jgi:undecaprenyl-diphosphatase
VVADWIEDYVTFWAVPLFVVATFSLWILDRPGRAQRWRVACMSGLVSAALGLAIGQVISHVWMRERPFAAHPTQTLLLVPGSGDPSFPSDHATAAFAIAFSVLLVGRRLGAVFVLAALMIGMSRIFVGVHYPGDVAGGALVGLVAALVVWRAGRGRWSPIVDTVSRVTDPVVEPLWRAPEAIRARKRRLEVR